MPTQNLVVTFADVAVVDVAFVAVLEAEVWS